MAVSAYTPVPNTLIEALAQANIPSTAIRVLLYLTRRTYGWHKTAGKVSTRQIAADTRLDRRNVQRTLEDLEAASIIRRLRRGQDVTHFELLPERQWAAHLCWRSGDRQGVAVPAPPPKRKINGSSGEEDLVPRTPAVDLPVVVVCARELEQIGVARKTADRLAQAHPADLIRRWLDYTAELVAEGALRRPAGFIVAAIEQSYVLPPVEPAPGSAPAGSPGSGNLLQLRQPSAAGGDVPSACAPAPPAAIEPAAVAEGGTWWRVRAILANTIQPALFAQWIAPIHVVDDADPCRLTLAVPDERSQRYLDQRLRRVVELTLSQITGQPASIAVLVESPGEDS